MESWRALGVAHLLLGQPDRALESFGYARSLAPEEAALLSDVAVAYLLRARQRLASQEASAAISDFEAALQATKSALEKNPRQPEALFNRALILEERRFRGQAIEAWRAYLQVDSQSRWAAEARHRLSMLAGPSHGRLWDKDRSLLTGDAEDISVESVRTVVGRFPQQSRLLVQDDLLPSWGHSRIDSNLETASGLPARLILIAETLADVSGDRFLADSIERLEAAARLGESSAVLSQLAQGHALYGEARQAYRSGNIRLAAGKFEEALEPLQNGRSPFANAALVGLASCHFYNSDLAASERIVSRLLNGTTAVPERHRSIVAQAEWLRGLVTLLLGRPHEAGLATERALKIFEGLGEAENAAAMHAQLAEVLSYLGDFDRAWMHRDRGLDLLTKLDESQRLPVSWAETGRAYLRAEHRELSRLAHATLVDQARRRNQAPVTADALLWAGLAEERRGDSISARTYFRTARRVLNLSPTQGFGSDWKPSWIWPIRLHYVWRADPRRLLQSLERSRSFEGLATTFGLQTRCSSGDVSSWT